MSPNDIVQVDITVTGVTPRQANFGTPASFSASTSATWTDPGLVRTYVDPDAVDVDFPAGSPELVWATKVFSQSPAVPEIKLLRLRDAQPVQISVISLSQVLVGAKYAFMLRGLDSAGVAFDVEVNYTAVGGDTNDVIIAGLVTDAGTPPTGVTIASTGSVGSKVLTITGTARVWLAPVLQDADGRETGPMGSPALLLLTQDAADTGTAIATQIANAVLEDDDWYTLTNPYQGQALDTAIAADIEARDKEFVQSAADTDIITVADGSATDLAHALKNSGYGRTGLIWHHRPDQLIAGAWVGRLLTIDPGAENWAGKQLAGVEASKLNATHVTNLRAKNASWFASTGGLNITREGRTSVGSAAGYLDIPRARDWLKNQIQITIIGALVSADKIPADESGRAVIKAAIFKVLDLAYGRKVIVKPKAADVSFATVSYDPVTRTLSGILFQCTLTGAVNKVIVKGTISVAL